MYSFLHIIQTGIFLIEHFVESEDINDMVKLDMNIWQQNHILKSKIPRYIHQIWISSIENKEIYEKFRIAANFCIELHSNYNYTLWTHENILNWLKIEYSWFLPTYKNYRYDMQRIDSMKYFFLFHFGGIYIDLDIKCNVKDIITSMIPKNQTIYEPDIIFHMGGEGISANTDIMAAKQGHPFFKLAINRLKSANRWFYLYHLTIILSAGPTFLYGIYRKYPLKENFYFIPNNLLWGKIIDGVGGATWYGKDTLVLIFITKNKISLCFLLVILSTLLFYVFKVLKRKRY
jgi:mannosyltransferase OCH1-like enzyme